MRAQRGQGRHRAGQRFQGNRRGGRPPGARRAGGRPCRRRAGDRPEHLGHVQPAQEGQPARSGQCEGGRHRLHLAVRQHAAVAGAGSPVQRPRGLFHLRRSGQSDRHRLQRLSALSGRGSAHARGHAVRGRLPRRPRLPRGGARDHAEEARGGVQVRRHRGRPQGGQLAHRCAGRQLCDDRRSAAPGGGQRGGGFRRDPAGGRGPGPAAAGARQARRGGVRRRRAGHHRVRPHCRGRADARPAGRGHPPPAGGNPAAAGFAGQSGGRRRQQRRQSCAAGRLSAHRRRG